MTQGTNRRNLGRGLLAGACVLVSTAVGGCFETYDNAFPEGDDVRLELPGQDFRAAGDQGEVYTLIETTARDVNGTVSELVQGVGTVVAALNGYPETRMDGDWRVYGPFEDDEGRDLSWMVKIQGDADETDYQVLVGARDDDGSTMDTVMEGSVVIDGSHRSGDFRLDFDAIEKHPSMKDPEDAGVTFAGAIEVEFTRNIETEQKSVQIDFVDFSETAILGDAWYSDDTYVYDRGDDGDGTFHLAVNGRWDEGAFGGMRVNRLELDARWNPAEAGRARGMVLDIENEDSALPNGDLVIHECFEAGGALTYAGVNEAYRAELGHYVDGDEASCAFAEDEL